MYKLKLIKMKQIINDFINSFFFLKQDLFVSINPEIFRCTTCGSDCRQYVNGSIKYLPAFSKPTEINKDVKGT